MKYSLPVGGALGHQDLKHALKKPDETSLTDLVVKNKHNKLHPFHIGERLAPNQKLAPKWPQLQYGAIPEVDKNNYTLEVLYHGQLLGSLTLDDLLSHHGRRSLPDVDFHCVTGWSCLGLTFDVIPLTDLYTTKHNGDKRVFCTCIDGFTSSLQMENWRQAYICFGALGLPLEPKHGYPVRLLVPTKYGFKSAKWIKSIDIIEQDTLGFWELRGYDDSADPWLEERFAGKTGQDGLTAAQRAKRELKK